AALPHGAAAKTARAAIVVTGRSLPSDDADAIALQIRRALDDRPDLKLVSPTDEARLFRAAPPNPDRSKRKLADAEESLEDAEANLRAFDLPSALKNVSHAKSELQLWFGLHEAINVDRQRLELAVALAHAQRNEGRQREAMIEYATRFPNELPVPGRWPP